MSKLVKLKEIFGNAKIGPYSDDRNTSVENGIEFGFGLVLGVSSAVILMLLLFFVVKSMFIGV